MESIRILVADDHTVVRDGLTTMLGRQRDFSVVGEAKNGREAVEKARELRPDIILMDLRMPELDGVEAMRRIRSEDASVNFIVLTTFDTDEYIFDAIEAGAKGYLMKDTSRDELFRAIHAVHQGESLIEPGVASKVLDRFAELSRRAAPADVLSERELEVLSLIATGAGNKGIAEDLSISESTVKTHVANIFQKLDVSGRTDAVTRELSQNTRPITSLNVFQDYLYGSAKRIRRSHMSEREKLGTIWEVSDELWERIEPVILEEDPPKARGRKRADAREMLNGIIFRLRSGCQWNQLPKELGDDSTIHRTLQRWVELGVMRRVWAALIEGCDELGGVQWEWQAADAAMSKARLGGT